MTKEEMEFPNTFDEFVKSYGVKDDKEVYTNGSELIPVFRVKQWLDHIKPYEDAVLYIIALANKYNLEITIEPGNGMWVLDIRRYIIGTGTRDRWVKSTRFTLKELEDLKVDFETILSEIDKDFTESFERFLEEGEVD